MSKFDELIKEFCPDGVEYRPLNDKTLFDFHYGKGNKIPEDTGGKYDVYGANGIVSHIDEYNCEDISIIGHIGAVGFINRCKTKCFVTYNGTIADIVDKSRVNSQYFYYVLTTLDLPSYKKGSQPFLSVSDFEKIEIPVPPLPMQEEIVRILDKFTELTARRKQYEYYRDSLLTFDDDVEWKALGEIAKYSDTRIKNTDIKPYSYVSVENLLQQKKGVEFTDKIPEGNNSIEYLKDDILIGNIRPYLRKIWKADRIGGTNGDVLTIRIKNDYKKALNPQYLYYQLSSEDFFNYDNQHAKGAKMPRGSKDDVMKYKISIPSLSEQEKIVSILDRFESLCNDITSGLPAEIEARHKQYEYYRDKLLTFKRKEA